MDTDLVLFIGTIMVFFFPIIFGFFIVTYRVIRENINYRLNYNEIPLEHIV